MRYLEGIAVVLVVIFIGYVLFQNYERPRGANTNPDLPMGIVYIGTQKLDVELATTDAARTLGLSKRSSLDEGKGMLFIFEPAREVGFWMKDMNFSIDMIFADEAGVITRIYTDVAPNTYPNRFSSGTAIRYVLEVPAGYTTKQGIAVGQKIVVQ